MRIAHLSDTHLGYSDLDVLDESGVLLRELDVYRAFARAVDAMLAAQVDAVIHSGDLFHRASPSNRALTEGLAQLKRLADAGLPVIVLAGNHDAPRTAFTAPIFRALESLPGVRPVYAAAETIRLGNLAIQALPHLLDDRDFYAAFDALAPVPGAINVLALHASVGPAYLMDEYGERAIDPARQERLSGFAYTALGHWHGFRQLDAAGAPVYSGSLECLGEREVGQDKGWVLVEFNGSAVRVTRQPVEIRPQHQVRVDKCHQLDNDEILRRLREQAAGLPLDGAIVRVHLADLSPEQGAGLTNRAIAAPFATALPPIVTRDFLGGQRVVNVVDLRHTSLADLLDEHLAGALPDAAQRARVAALARRYLQEADE